MSSGWRVSYSTTDYPYRTVVYITDDIGGVSYQASGVLLSPDEVLTASHVVYDAGAGAAYDIQVSPGYGAGSAPYGTVSAKYYHYFPIDDANDSISSASSQSDYAIIHLAQPFDVGTMGYESNFTGGAVHVTGYPGSGDGYQIDTTETVHKDPHYSLLDGSDTGRGSSGGPVWVVQNNLPYVVGLVSSGDGTNGYNVQITSSVYDQIGAWINQDDFTSPLVDPTFYDALYPDVAAAFETPAYHYYTDGWHEGRYPNAYFSTVGYLAFNADVRAAGVNPLAHYDQSGWKEGRDPSANFDTTLYLLHNPDVAASGMDPLVHFLHYGQAEGRATYAAIGPASTIVGGFDPEYYLLSNPDVAAAGVDPWTHFNTFGWREGRDPDSIFNTALYLARNPDVAAAGVDPLVHYDNFGWREGRNPSDTFSTRGYLAANPDVAAAGVDPMEHYLQFGVYEGRSPLGTLQPASLHIG